LRARQGLAMIEIRRAVRWYRPAGQPFRDHLVDLRSGNRDRSES
jgi:hypothetical protein